MNTNCTTFGLVVAQKDGSFKVQYLDLSWTRNKAERACVSACAKHLADIRVAKISLNYLGMGKMENITIVKVY